MKKTGITPEQVLLELEWREIGYEKICTLEDGLDTKIILGKDENFVIISTNYSNLETNVLTLDRRTIEKMFSFTKGE